MVGFNAKVVSGDDFREHRLKRCVADLPLPFTLTTDQMMMWFDTCDLVICLAISGIRRNNDAQFNEETDRPVDR